jgi:hypothetical protein
MRNCDYFACTDIVDDPDDKGFDFCCYHLDYLEQLVAQDLVDDGFSSLQYCLAALNGKAYLRSRTIL